MTIKNDENIEMIKQMLNLSTKRLSEDYSTKSIDEVMEAEAEQGNATSVENFDKEILNDPKKLVEAFKLSGMENKMAILNAMNSADIASFLPLLEPQDLIIGLKFFTSEKLMKLMEELPKEQMVKLVLELFSQRELFKLMPEEQFNKCLTDVGIDKNQILKHLKELSPKELAKALEKATGKPVDVAEPEALTKMFAELDPLSFNQALILLDEDQKRQLITIMSKEDEKIYERFDNKAYANILATKDKPDVIKSSIVLEPEQLIKMLGELPSDLMALVISLMDSEKFAEHLIKNFSDVLKD